MNPVPAARPAPVSDSLIERLSEQHRQVETLVAGVTEALAHNRLARSRELLISIRSALLGHLALEDLELYPALIVAAQRAGLREEEQLARTFATNMERISQQLKEFFARHTSHHADSAALKHEFPSMLKALAARIQSEETMLYPLYTKLCVTRR